MESVHGHPGEVGNGNVPWKIKTGKFGACGPLGVQIYHIYMERDNPEQQGA